MGAQRIYKHLTRTDRLRIEKMLKEGLSNAEIAEKLRVSRQTIWRERKRGEYERLDGATWEMKTAYSPDIAQERYEKNLKEKGPELKIGNDQELADYLEKKMAEEDYSPAAAVAMAKKEKVGGVTLSAPTVYSYIRKGVFLNLEMKDLPRHDKHGNSRKHVEKKKAARAPAGESIEQRPKEVNDRSEFGHWEGDTVYSGKNKSRKAILTITERQTRKEIIIQIPNRKAETVVKALDAIERQWGAPNFRTVFRSITVDNGTEFADASGMEKSCINKTIPRTKVYYAHPYSSWERGTNENQNGMIRRKHPKGTNFAEVSKAELTETEEWMNNYPRKVLGYRSSNQLFNERLVGLGIKTA